MIKPLATQFIVADAGRARWVRRNQAADFTTTRELTAPPPERGEPLGVVFEASSGQRFGVEPKQSEASRRRVRFAEQVAEAINADVAHGGPERLVLIAPARMISAICQRLSAPARARVANTLAKDLGKTRDHELGRWLGQL